MYFKIPIKVQISLVNDYILIRITLKQSSNQKITKDFVYFEISRQSLPKNFKLQITIIVTLNRTE